MGIEIRAFDAKRDSGALQQFAADVWRRPESAEYWQWYLRCPRLEGVLALGDDGQIRALVFAIRRDYAVNGAAQSCLETFDWYCRPEDVGSGLGIFVMRTLMKAKLPIVALGAMPEAAALLRRLNFKEVASGEEWWMPLRGAALIARNRNPLLAHAYAATAGRYYRPKHAPSPESDVTLRIGAGYELNKVATEGTTFAPMGDMPLHEWLLSAPSMMGAYQSVTVSVRGRPVVWALTRVLSVGVTTRGFLLEWHADLASEVVATWAFRETLAILSDAGASSLHVATTDPFVKRLAADCHFRPDSRPDALVWTPSTMPSISERVHIMGGRGDGALMLFT